tara:strand:- start:8877 stop:9389 length:513 start_codon:yes stop_codon:yes gene_type:complete
MALTKLNFPSNTILQVKEKATNSSAFTQGTNYMSSALRLSITPSSTSSKILVIPSANMYNNSSGAHGLATVYRGTSDPGFGQTTPSAVDIGDTANSSAPSGSYGGYGIGGTLVLGTGAHKNSVTNTILDEPNTTNPVWYFISIKTNNQTTYVVMNVHSERSVLTLIELKG